MLDRRPVVGLQKMAQSMDDDQLQLVFSEGFALLGTQPRGKKKKKREGLPGIMRNGHTGMHTSNIKHC